MSKLRRLSYPPNTPEQHRLLGAIVSQLRDKGLTNNEVREVIERRAGGDIDPADWADTMLDVEAYEGSQYR